MAEYHEDHLQRARRKAGVIIIEGFLVLWGAATAGWFAWQGNGLSFVVALFALIWGTARVVKGVRYRRDPVKLIRDLQFV